MLYSSACRRASRSFASSSSSASVIAVAPIVATTGDDDVPAAAGFFFSWALALPAMTSAAHATNATAGRLLISVLPQRVLDPDPALIARLLDRLQRHAPSFFTLDDLPGVLGRPVTVLEGSVHLATAARRQDEVDA